MERIAYPALVGLAVLIAGALGYGAAQAPRQGPLFANPPMLSSRNGRLHVDLVEAPGVYTIGGRTFHGMLYNGEYMPAVWRVRPGDILQVTLHNHLPEPTNLHFHGLDVSPRGNGDNVFLDIRPGESFGYQIKIPETHVGLFWFHPHRHPYDDQQINAGLSGGIIVDGSDRVYPFLKRLKNQVIFFKQHPMGPRDHQELVTVNGMVAPRFQIRPGEAQWWEMANIGADQFMRVKVEGMPFYLIGRDGYFVPRPVRMDEVLIGPAQRVSAIVVGGQAGEHAFKALPFKPDNNEPPLPEYDLGTVVSQGPATDVAAMQASVLGQHVDEPLYVDRVRSSPIARRRRFVFSETLDGKHYLINGKVFDPNRIDVSVKLGDTEEWTVINSDTQYHNFHIHQTGFLVTEVNGAPEHYDGLRDTFTMTPIKDGKPGSIKLIIPFTNPAIVGRFVFHCHVVRHEDKGMMLTVVVHR